jgi:hypothetical protein
MLFNLLFLTAYFTPLILKAILLILLAHLEVTFMNKFRANTALGDHGLLTELADPATACAALRCKPVPIYDLLLGLNVNKGVMIAGITLLVYNAVRFVLTLRIAPLKERESITKRTPYYFEVHTPRWWFSDHHNKIISWMIHYYGYARQLCQGISNSYAMFWYLHRVIRIIFYFALALTLYHAVVFFKTDVRLPGRLLTL